jgi:hypothetical protein
MKQYSDEVMRRTVKCFFALSSLPTFCRFVALLFCHNERFIAPSLHECALIALT